MDKECQLSWLTCLTVPVAFLFTHYIHVSFRKGNGYVHDFLDFDLQRNILSTSLPYPVHNIFYICGLVEFERAGDFKKF